MKVTREMVAERAGVCKQTVSCYLNNTRKISPKLSARIEQAIAELNYVPDMIARGLSQKRTMALGVVCSDLTNPNYSEVIEGIEHAAHQKDYSIFVFGAKEKNHDSMINQLIARRVDGVVVLDFKAHIGDKGFKRLSDNGIKVVLTHSAGEISKEYMQLEPDFGMGIRETLLTLKQLGHSDIVMLSCFDTERHDDKRLQLFAEYYQEIFGKKAVFLVADEPVATLQTGSSLAKKLLDGGRPVTAVLTTNDLMAIGAMKELSDRGLTDQISVVGFDNVLYAEYLNPSLSSIGYNKSEYGEKLFKLFEDSFEGKESRVEFVQTMLFRRSSIRAAAKA